MKVLLSLTCVLVLFTASMAGCTGSDEVGKKGETEMKGDQPQSKGETAQVSEEGKAHGDSQRQNPIVTIETDFGNMVVEMYRDVAPGHVDSFVARTNDGFYNGLTFHRIIDHFMIQGGDPSGNGTGNAGYFLNAEFSDLPHEEGTLSMARSQSPNSASCQFFVCLERNRSLEGLDGKYTVFGHLIKGYETLHKIGSTPVESNPVNPGEKSKPVQTVFMREVYVSDAEGKPLAK